MRKRRQKKIAEIVTDEAASRMKTILKKAPEQRFVFRKSHHAVANVAWRKDAVLASKASGAAPIVGDSYNCSKLRNGAVRIGMLVATPDDVFLKPAQQSRQSRAPAKRDDAEPARKSLRLFLFFLHRMT